MPEFLRLLEFAVPVGVTRGQRPRHRGNDRVSGLVYVLSRVKAVIELAVFIGADTVGDDDIAQAQPAKAAGHSHHEDPLRAEGLESVLSRDHRRVRPWPR